MKLAIVEGILQQFYFLLICNIRDYAVNKAITRQLSSQDMVNFFVKSVISIIKNSNKL